MEEPLGAELINMWREEAREDIEKAFAEGFAEGREEERQNREQQRKRTVRKLSQAGFSSDIIADILEENQTSINFGLGEQC